MKFTILYALQIAITLIQAGQKRTNKGVIKLHKKEGKENKYNNTQKEKPHTNSSTGVLLLEKKTKITTEGIYNVSG